MMDLWQCDGKPRNPTGKEETKKVTNVLVAVDPSAKSSSHCVGPMQRIL